MAAHGNVTVPAATWTQLTSDDATTVTFFNLGANPIYIEGTTSAVAPTTMTGVVYPSLAGERGVSLSSLFPGIAAVRLYAYSHIPATVFISHD